MFRRIIWLFVFVTLLTGVFFGLGDQILFGKAFMMKLIPIALIFLGIPFSLCRFLKTFGIKHSILINRIVPLSVLILGPIFGLWSGYISENDIKNHGKWITGKVVRKEWSSKRPRAWLITGEFIYKGKKFQTYSKAENKKSYHLGEPVLILFSIRNPENNELILN